MNATTVNPTSRIVGSQMASAMRPGGDPRRFRPYVDLYKQSVAAQFGPLTLPVAAHSPGHVAATDAQAKEELWPHYEAMINRIGRERGWPPATSPDWPSPCSRSAVTRAAPWGRCAPPLS